MAERNMDNTSEVIPSTNVNITNVPSCYGSNEIHSFCSQFGPVVCIAAIDDAKRTDGGVIWFVCFSGVINAMRAVQHLNGRLVLGEKPIEVKFAEKDIRHQKRSTRTTQQQQLKASASSTNSGCAARLDNESVLLGESDNPSEQLLPNEDINTNARPQNDGDDEKTLLATVSEGGGNPKVGGGGARKNKNTNRSHTRPLFIFKYEQQHSESTAYQYGHPSIFPSENAMPSMP
jgi:hypothetical protein